MKKKNLNLNKARTVKNDEFYTLYEDDFFMQGGRGHYTKVMKVLCYYDKEGRAKFPFVRLLIQKK